MPKLNVVLPHMLSQEEVLRRIKDLLPQVQKEYVSDVTDLSQEWQGNTGKFSFRSRGGKVSGTLTVRGANVELSADLPFAAIFIKGTIEKTVKKRGTALLA
ncbi:MAG: polyhydroxyalkanoic acid system family protein [Candidatus Wildermuthbacteria bacterium]|nr:polyhydroxyalkanoic acid system family protein [Candidatus Wildermuthbacteria bacterium]